MIHPCSLFVVLPRNIIELNFSRDERSEHKNDQVGVSQFLLYSAAQYILQVDMVKKSWKNWLFFVLQFALGEGFRIDSFRDYPRKEFTQINLKKFLVNQYELIVTTTETIIELRIIRETFDHYSKLDPEGASIITPKIKEIHPPLDQKIFRDHIRILDLKVIPKRFYVVTPDLNTLHVHLIRWKDVTTVEYNLLDLPSNTPSVEEISLLPPILSEEELQDRNWNKYRVADLEQPRGLYCPRCQLDFKPNIFAKTCSTCSLPLSKA